MSATYETYLRNIQKYTPSRETRRRKLAERVTFHSRAAAHAHDALTTHVGDREVHDVAVFNMNLRAWMARRATEELKKI